MPLRLCLLVSFLALFACQSGPTCPVLDGQWASDEAMSLVFTPEGRALWLTRFGQHTDTLTSDYTLDCTKEPATIDFVNFSGGPYAGNALRGILDTPNDTTLRLRYEPGTDRPEAFDREGTVVLKKLEIRN